MKLNNEEIFAISEPLNKLMGEKFPVKVAYGLAKLANSLQGQLKVINDVRNGLIRTYGKPDPENAQNIKIDPEDEVFGKYLEEMNELLAQEIEVDFEKVKLPEKVAATCDKCHHNMDKMLEIEPKILVALGKLIEVE